MWYVTSADRMDLPLTLALQTGRPNVDWCEDHKQETIRANVIGTVNLADAAFLRNIHVTVYATGCIYEVRTTLSMLARVD